MHVQKRKSHQYNASSHISVCRFIRIEARALNQPNASEQDVRHISVCRFIQIEALPSAESS